MVRNVRAAAMALLLTAAAAGMPAFAAGDAANGRAIAVRWCADCHLVSPDQRQALADVPSFQAIVDAAGGELVWLSAFLADPHPVMPDMSLTRQEIQNLVAYFDQLAKRR